MFTGIVAAVGRIERIELKYSNRKGGGSATVQVFGHR